MIDTLAQIRWLITDGQSWLNNQDQLPQTNLESWQRSILQQQQALRKRSARRFTAPEKWLWTEKSLSQASDWWSAKFKSSLIPQAVDVVDICCGAGVDSVALAMGRSVTSVDADPIMLELTKCNAATHNSPLQTRQELVSNQSLFDQPWVHIDPDRRPDTTRTIAADCFSPSLTDVLSITDHRIGAIVKLAPTTLISSELEQVVNANYQRCWIGNFGESRQQLLLRGECQLSYHGRRVACLLEPQWSPEVSAWTEHLKAHTFSCTRTNLTDQHETADVGQYVYDLHSVLHSSHLAKDFGNRFGLTPLTNESGYYTSDRHCPSVWSHAFRVLDVLPWDDRQIRKWLRNCDAGLVEVKNRLIALSANEFQRRYSRTQGRQITLLVTKIDGRVRAIAAERATEPTDDSVDAEVEDAGQSYLTTYLL